MSENVKTDKKKKAEKKKIEGEKVLDRKGIIMFSGNVTMASVETVIKKIFEKNNIDKKDKPKELTLVINSYGGSLDAAFALIDAMRGSKLPVQTIASGVAASAGCLILMSGEPGKRMVTRNCSVMSHHFWSMNIGNYHDLKADSEYNDLLHEKMMRHYKKCTGLKRKTIEKKLLGHTDLWMEGRKVVKMGIADRIIDEFRV